jgi:hypothetical protein
LRPQSGLFLALMRFFFVALQALPDHLNQTGIENCR